MYLPASRTEEVVGNQVAGDVDAGTREKVPDVHETEEELEVVLGSHYNGVAEEGMQCEWRFKGLKRRRDRLSYAAGCISVLLSFR